MLKFDEKKFLLILIFLHLCHCLADGFSTQYLGWRSLDALNDTEWIWGNISQFVRRRKTGSALFFSVEFVAENQRLDIFCATFFDNLQSVSDCRFFSLNAETLGKKHRVFYYGTFRASSLFVLGKCWNSALLADYFADLSAFRFFLRRIFANRQIFAAGAKLFYFNFNLCALHQLLFRFFAHRRLCCVVGFAALAGSKKLFFANARYRRGDFAAFFYYPTAIFWPNRYLSRRKIADWRNQNSLESFFNLFFADRNFYTRRPFRFFIELAYKIFKYL